MNKKQTEADGPVLEITLERRYELIREQIRHEDGLINQRLNWLLLSQGFLIAAFTSIITTTSKSGAVPTVSISNSSIIFVIAIPIVGFVLNWLSFIGLNDAYKSLKYLRQNWHAARPTTKNGQRLYDSFPHITWEGSAITTASSTPIVITFAWLIAAEWMLFTIQPQTLYIKITEYVVVGIYLAIIAWMSVLTGKSMK